MQLSSISLAITRLGRPANPDAAIKALFASGEQGAWYDPSDLSTMFQDSAGTTPVTAAGQPVGKILDKSGRGNHASQATAAARPILQTDGTYWWLRGDGVDDMVQTPTIGWANTLTWVHGMSVDSFGTERRFTGNIRQRVAVLTDSRLRFSFVGVVDMYSAAGFFVAGEKIVTAVLVDPTGIGKTKFRKNGAANSTVTSTATSGVADEPTGIFAQGVTSGLPMPGNIYSVILINRILTTDEITETEAWVNRKIGAY